MDAVVYLGMANEWEVYSVKERAFSERFSSDWWHEREEGGYYLVPDADGKTGGDIVEVGRGCGMICLPG